MNVILLFSDFNRDKINFKRFLLAFSQNVNLPQAVYYFRPELELDRGLVTHCEQLEQK